MEQLNSDQCVHSFSGIPAVVVRAAGHADDEAQTASAHAVVLHHSQRPVDVPVAVFRQLDDGEGRHHVSLDGIEVNIILPFYNDDLIVDHTAVDGTAVSQ